MSMSDTLFGDHKQFEDKSGRDLRLIDVRKGHLYCWHILRDSGGSGSGSLLFVHPKKVDIPTLKLIGVWSDLSEEIRNELTQIEAVVAAGHKERMAKVRASRKPRKDYEGLPREIECSQCGDMTQIAPSTLVQRAKLQYIEGEERASRLAEWLAGYKCSTCSPRRRGRKPNPLNDGIPKKVACTNCGREVGIVPGQIRGKAEKLGTTVEALLANYRCGRKECGGRLPRKKKKK